MSLLHSNGYVHDISTNDVTNEPEALFFVHPTSFKIWRAFSHVLMINATYKTNKYNMPFVQIVGVTSIGKTFCIAFAFISEEKMDNYKWVLECLKLTLDECMLSRVIITDKDLALMKACEKVFPNATRLLYRWHISQNILKNCRQTIKAQRDWDFFLLAWKLIEDSPTWISYMENYKQLQLVLRKYPRELHRLNDLELNYSACGCQLRKSCGLPCACELLAYLNSGEAIPLDSVDIFWRALDVSWSTPLEHEDIQCDDELHIFKETFNKESNAGKKSLLRSA
ncbi:FAR1-related sequence 5-like protein [Tanacetum coccineum]